MNPTAHHVRSLQMKVQVGQAEQGFRVREQLRSDWDAYILPALQQAFDEVDPGNAWVHISRLTIRLRVKDQRELAERLPEWILEELRRQLPQHLSRSQAQGAGLRPAQPGAPLDPGAPTAEDNAVVTRRSAREQERAWLFAALRGGGIPDSPLDAPPTREALRELAHSARAWLVEQLVLGLLSPAAVFRWWDLLEPSEQRTLLHELGLLAPEGLVPALRPGSAELAQDPAPRPVVPPAQALYALPPAAPPDQTPAARDLRPRLPAQSEPELGQSPDQTPAPQDEAGGLLPDAYADAPQTLLLRLLLLHTPPVAGYWFRRLGAELLARLGPRPVAILELADLVRRVLPPVERERVLQLCLETEGLGALAEVLVEAQASPDAELVFSFPRLEPVEAVSPLRFERAPEPEPELPRSVSDAGMVLLHPYLPYFLDGLGVTQNLAGQAIPEERLPRALSLLSLLLTGVDQPHEPTLTVCKLLLGLHPDDPVLIGPGLVSEADELEAQNLLEAVIAHWGALGHSSPAGLRATFLQRPGRLRLRPKSWELRVAPAPFDMLIGKLPWGLSVVCLPWMSRPLFTEWESP